MMQLLQILSAFILGLGLVFYSIPVIVKISHEKHLFDVPNARKVNKHVVPNLGGIALFVGITLATLLSISNNLFPEFRYILSGMIILFFIGIKDDILIISAHKKFTAQILCASILIILGDIRFTNLHGILGFHEINYAFSVFISLLSIVAIINAQNLIDGIDGLAASIGILATLLFGTVFFLADQINYAILCAATTGSLISFFIYNVYGRKNKIFMGDTGSLILGLLLSVFVIQYNEFSISGSKLVQNFSPVFSLAILAVPVFDMIRIFLLRIYKGKSPFAPDMNHIHHEFLRLGLSHRRINLIIITANLLIIGIIFAFRTANNNILLMLLITLISVLMLFPRFLHSTKTLENNIDPRGHLLPSKKKFNA